MYELRVLPCPENMADTLSEALEELGALSVSMMDYEDQPILEPGVGETPLWNQLILTALFEEKETAEKAKQYLQKAHAEMEQTLEELPDQDWERVCLERFQPIQFGHRLWICPSWLKPPQEEAVNLILDPGLAFGTGTHNTTALCLKWLDGYDLSHQTLIDYGCGSGILALAALKLGATHAYAVDIDDQALLATAQNQAMNHISDDQISISHPEKLETPVDLILANILLTPLLSLEKTFYRLLKPEGKLIVSGIFASQINTLENAYQQHFRVEKYDISDEWALIEFSRL